MRLFNPILALPLLLGANALHFYFESNEKRCFMEELPSDTVVEGHYRALLWDEPSNSWTEDKDMGIQVTVEELTSGHTVVNTLGPPDGRFTFSSHDPGDHQICLSTNKSGGWLSNVHVKMYLDLQVGSSKHDASADHQHVETLATRLRELNNKLEDIKREQRYMREVEATFRDASESTNSRAVWWSIIQIAVLIGTATWQMRYLRHYFADKKLR
ncbi:putative ER to Golgi transport-related protein [Papiliotrema laurentii]|uniref:ER to Golgi transport-related protein n=1 Tax=Papiliotrema laurentii TaxID=5418 RepID=A0AAD9FV66_PAPLA|nr:putative ER to Golgi transport-related protein [Papiliotrema laurentii]